MVSPLLDAAGVLHSSPRLVLLPDDPALGEFRPEFGGLLGMIEARQADGPGGDPGIPGATKVVGTDELFDRLEKRQDEQVDARAFLSARLVDLFLGDWDRHQDQWRWARIGEGADARWMPIPRDRDQAFARFDGLLLSLARLSVPQLVEFSATYPSIVGLTWNGRVLDRRLLTGLDRPAWDSAAAELQGRLTDSVIDGAVERLPAELKAANGAWLAAALKHRRDQLPLAARRFYRILAAEADVYASDKAERVEAVHASPGSLDLTIYPAGEAGATPLFHRRFDRAETREVRLYLHGGDDAVLVGGEASGAPLLRVIGGGGDDSVVDSSRRWPHTLLRCPRQERGERLPPRPARHPAVCRLPAERLDALPRAGLGRFLALQAVGELGARGGILLRGRTGPLRLRLPEAPLALAHRLPGGLCHRRPDVSRRGPRGVQPGSTPGSGRRSCSGLRESRSCGFSGLETTP